MPAWVKDDDLWERAKGIVRREYRDVPEGSDRFWRLVTGAYKQAGGTMQKAFHVRCPSCRRVAVDVNDEGALVLKSRCLEAAADGGAVFLCKCNAKNSMPAEVLSALGTLRVFLRVPGTAVDTEAEPRSSS